MKYLKSIGLFFGIFLIFNLIISILTYFNILNPIIIKILKIISILLSSLISGFYIGLKANKKGYLEGIKISLIIILFLTILNLFSKNINFTNFTWLYYLIILILEIISSSIGINKKKANN